MQKVTSVNLRGKAYQLEEKAYALLEDYLTTARSSLKQDPDKDEVMHDFEQAVADKCDQLLSEHKTVVTTDEVKKIIEAMGPVEAADTTDPKAHSADAAQEPIKKLYTLKDGALIGGVCSGLGAYFNVDVVIVRLAFIVLALFTFGFSVLLYLALMHIVPEAKTPEQKAELRGQKFNAKAVIDRAKQKYAEVSQYPHWKGDTNSPAFSNVGDGIMKALRVTSLISAVVFALAAVAVTVGASVLVWSLTAGSMTLDETLRSIPLLHINAGIVAAYLLVFIPLVSMTYLSYQFGKNKPVSKRADRAGIISSVVWTIVAAALLCFGIAYRTELRTYSDSLNKVQPNTQMHENAERSLDRPPIAE